MNIGFRLSSYPPAATLLAAGFLSISMPAAAQDEDYERIVTIMRACSQIEDMVARVTCYDNNIGPRIAMPTTPAGPRPEPEPQAQHPQGFGAEMVPQVRQQVRAEQADEVEARVAASRMIEPGIYIVTLADGAEWRFTDSASRTYDPPQAGDTVRLERGTLGSVMLHFASQEGLRVRRIR